MIREPLRGKVPGVHLRAVETAQLDRELGHLAYTDLDPNPSATTYVLNDNGKLT